MSKPAAVIGCHHSCPAYDGDHAHVGGAVLGGSPNVRINGLPACRVGDHLQCSSPSPDAVLSGSVKVLINGMGAARKLDPTVHGGKLEEGIATVSIG